MYVHSQTSKSLPLTISKHTPVCLHPADLLSRYRQPGHRQLHGSTIDPTPGHLLTSTLSHLQSSIIYPLCRLFTHALARAASVVRPNRSIPTRPARHQSYVIPPSNPPRLRAPPPLRPTRTPTAPRRCRCHSPCHHPSEPR